MQKIKDKLSEFVAHLSDEEIEEQLENIFQWAQVYQNLLEREQKTRKSKVHLESNGSDSLFDKYDSYDEIITTQPDSSTGIDYYYIQALQEKLQKMSEDEIQEGLNKLKRINMGDLNDEEREMLEYEIEACELYLHDIRHDAEENKICPMCGNILPQYARFCAKCGSKITDEEE